MTIRPARLDLSQLAAAIVSEAIGETEVTPPPKPKDVLAVERGKARADSLTPEQREAIAKKAAKERWKKP